jgi:PAS domain S-box-containing protein
MQPTMLQHYFGFLQNAALPVLGVIAYAWGRAHIAGWSRGARTLAEGAWCAALAILCMSAPLLLSAGVQVDARNAVIAVAAVFGGAGAGLITAAAAIAFRLWLGGIGAAGGVASIVAALGVTLALSATLRRIGHRFGYGHLVLLAAAIAVSMLATLALQPAPVALEILAKAGLAGLTIVPGSVVVFGGILLMFERAREAERELAQSEARLRSVIDNLPQPLAVKDPQGRLARINDAYARSVGKPAGELIGMTASEVWESAGIKGDAALLELDERVRRTGERQKTAPLRVDIGNSRLAVVASAFPIRGAGGEIEATGLLLDDLTELMQAREALEQRQATLQRHQRALIEMVRANLVAEPDFTFAAAVQKITEIAGEALQVEFTQVCLIDEEADVSRCIDEWVRSAGRHDRAPDLDRRDYREVLRALDRELVLAITDPMDPRLAARREVLKARNVRTAVLSGIYFSNRMAGHVGFIHVGDAREWTTEEIAFARSVADLIALMLMIGRHGEALTSLDLSSDAIYVEREDGRILYANRAALALAGLPIAVNGQYGPARLFPHAVQPLTSEHDVLEISWGISALAKELELRRTRLPGGGVVTVIEDVTGRKAERRERERLESQLQQASKMEAIGQLASGIAHDFNNLLGAVIGFAGFLEQDLPPDTEQHQFAQRILGACNRGKELVAQILAFTRARALDAGPVDLRDVLREGQELLAGTLPSTSRLVVDTGSVPLVVEANEGQLQQVLVNLCLNAHDAMAGQPGEIRVRLSHVAPGDVDCRTTLLTGRLDPECAFARLDVSDTGAGIPAENLPRIFEPFFTTKERGRGTGLGLAVVHGILASFGGACAVTSEPRKGTQFSIYLPLVGREVAAPTRRIRDERRELHGRERILVVDDDIDVTDMLAIGLERLGYEVAALNDPREALEVVAESPADWDAVVTDQLMPGMQGLALAVAVKKLRSDLMVILCTGLDDGATAPAAKAKDVDAFFVKPVVPEHIAAAIRRRSPKGRAAS